MNAGDEAKLLLECSLDGDGRIAAERVSAACDVACREGSDLRKLAILRKYLKLAKSRLKAATVTIESAGELSDEAYGKLKEFVAKRTGRADLVFERRVDASERRVDASLIGGVRIICGDVIWERSAKSELESIM